MDVTATQPLQGNAAASTNSASNAVISSDFETFLKMLTTQMQNQDPLNPIESSDYAVQLATFSGVEQQVRTNQLLADLANQMGSSGLSQLAGWIGMEARAPVSAQFNGSALTVWPKHDSTADRAELVVRDSVGAEVARQPLALGTESLSWDGKGADGATLPAGRYRFEVQSFRDDAVLDTIPAEVYVPVIEARIEDGRSVLVVQGDQVIGTNEISALRDPAAG
ncbi:MAG: flagellar hook assembly protein FlgD [Paracoccaceae bacterium]|nr:flagellar hook assembly protein FlgD [Paracoccaceae bacterium]